MSLPSNAQTRRLSRASTFFSDTQSAFEPESFVRLDEPGLEATEDARVWHLYNEESSKVDKAMMEGCNRNIDALLVFTGLFSAVLTTFIIQSYQQMLPNSTDTTNLLLTQFLLTLTTPNASTIATISQILKSSNGSEPSAIEIRWVNGLWFAALSCSLSAALISMLAKQWLQMVPSYSGSPRYRARQRQQRHMQLRKWHVFTLINSLPILLHAALLLFFAGLIVLLWSGDLAITLATFIIVALAYAFYLGSMWVSLIYPECPYQHPISGQLRAFLENRQPPPASISDLEKNVQERHLPSRVNLTSNVQDPGDVLDAHSIVWLLRQCSNEESIVITLQAIGGLPRTFTAFDILRNAGTIPRVLDRLSACFHHDSSSFDKECQIVDAQAAEKYCRAWMRLTSGTSATLPNGLLGQLTKSLSMERDPHVNAIVTCLAALDSLDSWTAQVELVNKLATLTSKNAILPSTERWLLDTFLECSLSWELHALSINDVTTTAIPVLLELLQRPTKPDSISQAVRDTVSSLLYVLTTRNNNDLLALIKTQDSVFVPDTYHKTLVPALSVMIEHPERFNIQSSQLEFVVLEFVKVASTSARTSGRLPQGVRRGARHALCKLYLDGHLPTPRVSESMLTEILQILHPPDSIPSEQHPPLTKALLLTISSCSEAPVGISALQLLEHLLEGGGTDVLQTFIENRGVAVLLRRAHTGETDSRVLQFAAIRTLCVFLRRLMVKSSKRYNIAPWTLDSMNDANLDTRSEKSSSSSPDSAVVTEQLDQLFKSDFFPTLLSIIGGRRWPLPEVAEVWMPALVLVCEARPEEPIWRSVVSMFRGFAERNAHGMDEQTLLDLVERMEGVLDLGGEIDILTYG
ncbi:hypothetical protein CVT24_012335 [Panaeolus cyanescens]|uniref:DUF6535 domain-containing protein n=1 Tax=Panaeolus cyanescens TaxID=181874 RepID=A0A409VYH3_9AGAR|nr:hypothetical protein CVT24_012335 [Panaeolus cyanescens]